MQWKVLLLAAFFLVGRGLSAQSDRYAEQVAVVEQLIKKNRYSAARAQAAALVSSGQEAQLPLVEARGRQLLALATLEDSDAAAAERVKAIRELRTAAQLFRQNGSGEELDEVLGQLKELTGDTNIDIAELPSVKARRGDLPSADSIEEASLEAIVSFQESAITALSDSQIRQALVLERQQRALDESAFARLNDSLLLLQQEGLIATQRTEVTRQRGQRNLFLALALAVLAILGALYYRFAANRRYQARLEEKNKIISAERQRSEELLLNILPITVAAELKSTGKATARRFESATVLFADFKGFSRLAAKLEPEELIRLLDEAFRAIDRIVRAHGLEKIKTIGDAYMCAGGLPEEQSDHAERTVRAALDIQLYMKGNPNFDARIGIHSGPVVAGVVGEHKFVYDIWGDTVNQASRLETAGEIGRVAISHTTKDLLPAEFACVAAGTFEAKNIGTMERFFVTLKERG